MSTMTFLTSRLCNYVDEAGVKPFLLKDYHFLLKESKAWKQLTDTFGIIDPSHEIPRQVVEEDGKIFVRGYIWVFETKIAIGLGKNTSLMYCFHELLSYYPHDIP